MSKPEEKTNEQREAAEDALLNVLLNESIGGEEPTDQIELILSRVEETKIGLATGNSSPIRLLVYAAIAASLLIVGGAFIVPALSENKQAALKGTAEPQSSIDTNLGVAEGAETEEEPKELALGENFDSDESSKFGITEQKKDATVDAISKPRALAAINLDLDKPFRQGSFDVQVPQADEPSPVTSKDKAHLFLDRMQSLEQAGSPIEDERSESRQRRKVESMRQQLGPAASKERRSQEQVEQRAAAGAEFYFKGRPSVKSRDGISWGAASPAPPATTNSTRYSASNSAEHDLAIVPSNSNQLGLIADGHIDTSKINDAERRFGSSSVFDTNPTNFTVPKITHRISESKSPNQYAPLIENSFVLPEKEQALSTFSIDVDTASYANTRQYLLQSNRMPPPNAVRIEELINYFDYEYDRPDVNGPAPFAANMEIASCPWQPKHQLVRIAIKGREVEQEKRPLTNLVFLLDVSGSMNHPNKLPLVVRGLKQLTRRLGENDRVAIVVYASSEGIALDSTPGSERQTILSALDRLAAGGSTAGGAGINLAYKIAEENFIKGGTNRVLLCTDGDFNVGLSDTDALGEMVERKAKESNIFLSVLGFGNNNLNDKMLEKITNQGNGNYSFIDSNAEARKVLVDQMTGTLVTIAKDVKIQVEFNPAKVASYRLIGYENRVMPNQDFNDDTKDAGEIGAGHTVTAFYEVVPVGATLPGSIDPLKYLPTKDLSNTIDNEPETSATRENAGNSPEEASVKPPSNELLTLKIRYKQPTEDESSKLEFILFDEDKPFEEATQEFRFASSVAQFGLLLRNSEYRGQATYEQVAKIAETAMGEDEHGYREEFLDLVDQAKKLISTQD